MRALASASCRFVRGLLAAAMLMTLVAGLPWALVHFVGWPLPEYLPTWDELQAVLMTPMTPEFLVDVLACVLWLLWARFTFDVIATIPDLIRAAQWPSHLRRGPLHAVAGILISAIVASIISSRTTTPTTPINNVAAELTTREHTAAAFYSPTPRTAALTGPTEIVRYPEHGVHDSLWRIAERRLVDGTRWTEIWTLNKHTIQTDGRVFTNPNLIYPGWELRLPAPAASEPTTPVEDPGASEEIPNTQHDSHTQADPELQGPAEPAPQVPPGISTPTGAFVGIGLAALITIALVTVRLHRRRRYRPGALEPDDPGRAPIVRALRIAHDDTEALLDDTPLPPGQPTRLTDLKTRDRAQTTALALQPSQDETVLGVRDGRAVALNTARGRGLGLIGLGAHAAARALIVSVLARTAADDDVQVIIPAADAHAVFNTDPPSQSSSRLRVVDNLTTALDVLEAELLTRARQAEAASAPHRDHTPLVLVATPTADTERRTQAVLDNGSTFNITGILLGQWRTGGTLRVRDDGTVGATSPNLADDLAGAQLFTLPSTDAADLLTLLSAVEAARGPITAEVGPRLDEPQTNTGTAPANASAGTYDFVLAEPSDPREQPTATRSTEDDRRPLVPGDVPTHASTAAVPPFRLQVLGRLHLTQTGTDLIEAIAPRQREILVYLALHRAGCRRESLTTALWPDAPGDRPYNSFHATLSQLRRALRKATSDSITDLLVNDDNHYQLNTALVTVDLWQLQDALAARHRADTSAERTTAVQHITELYHGDLATGIATDWIDSAREALRREVLEALSATIRTVDNDPEKMLTLLETARGMDPYNEAIYRDLMRVQTRLGQYDSIPRTLGLLTRSLAELDQRPTRDTMALAELLQRTPTRQQHAREAS